MKCDICGNPEVVIHVQQMTDGEEIELHLCDRCAAFKGITRGEDKVEFSISNLLMGLVDLKNARTNVASECPGCGLTLENFKKRAMLGCSECFNTFGKEIRDIVEKMFGRTRHKGKYPKRLQAYKSILIDLEGLKIRLEKAVEAENYEEAAKLRDQIKELSGS
jgi:protein arginine kinase activator